MRPSSCASNSRANASPSYRTIWAITFRQLLDWLFTESVEELRIEFAHLIDHRADDFARFRWRVACPFMRHKRWSTMPEIVCTMVVAAATGRT